MHNSDPQNDDFRDDELIQFIDLDSEPDPLSRRIEKMSAILHQRMATPWVRYGLSGSLILILLGALFLHLYWPGPVSHTLSYISVSDPMVITVSTPDLSAANPPGLLALQQRPLHLPTVSPGNSCPTSPEIKANLSFGIVQGNGPAYAAIDTENVMSPAILYYADAQHFANRPDNQNWGGQSVFWFINLGYQGLVLIRGHQLDGDHPMEFNKTFYDPLTQQLVLDTTHSDFSSSSSSSLPTFDSYTRLQAPGCYAYQVDGSNFSDIIVFQAVVKN